MGVRRFEDLVAWQKARSLVRETYRITGMQPLKNDFALARQLQRASVSVMSNIAEGFERKSGREFRHFLMIAKASTAEVRSLLYVVSDIGLIPPEETDDLRTLADEVSRTISGLRSSVFDTPRPKTSPSSDDLVSEPGTRNSERAAKQGRQAI